MSRRKRQPDDFDVVEFLRESDDDLKSALNSLLRSPEPIQPGPDSNLEPAIKLDPAGTLASPADLVPPPGLNPPTELDPHPILDGDPKLIPAIQPLEPTPVPAPNVAPGPKLATPRRFPIREMKSPHDAHTRAEQQMYERLWENARPLEDGSRSITMGFGAMARLVGLSESNARINMRSLIAKLAVEEAAGYNCAQSVGRTYRLLPMSEIMRRRREAGLLWYMRRTLAVVFVDPATGERVHQRRPVQRSLNNLQS